MKYGNNTRTDILASGQWVQIAKKHYQHIDGAEIKYDCMAWLWRIVGTDSGFKQLNHAVWAAAK